MTFMSSLKLFVDCNFIFLYNSPDESLEEFERFADNLELNLNTVAENNPY